MVTGVNHQNKPRPLQTEAVELLSAAHHAVRFMSVFCLCVRTRKERIPVYCSCTHTRTRTHEGGIKETLAVGMRSLETVRACGVKPGLQRQLESHLATGSLEMEACAEQELREQGGPGRQRRTDPAWRAGGGLESTAGWNWRSGLQKLRQRRRRWRSLQEGSCSRSASAGDAVYVGGHVPGQAG